MSARSIIIPPEDYCVIARLGDILTKRLVYGNDEPVRRQTLLRALFGLQRLPTLIAGLNLSISAGQGQLEINSEHCGFVSYTEDWHTEFCIQYFADSSHCLEGFVTLDGEQKIESAMLRLDDFEFAMNEVDEPVMEDYSTAGAVDEPPIYGHRKYAQARSKL